MICDQCGKEFRGHATEDTVSVGPSTTFARNKTVIINLCPECAERRRTLLPYILGVICVATGVLTVIGYLLKW